MKNVVDPTYLVDESVDDAFICGVCANLVNEMTTGCDEGHGICRLCYVTAIATSPSCPFCKQPTSADKLRKNRPFDDLVGALTMRCKHGQHIKGAGGSEAAVGSKRKQAALKLIWRCPWVGTVSAFDAHLVDECRRELVPCMNAGDGCPLLMRRPDMAMHAIDCVGRPVKCTHCKKIYPQHEIEFGMHTEECAEAPVSCFSESRGCTANNLKRKDLIDHDPVCMWGLVECTAIGCDSVVMRKDVDAHMSSSLAAHQDAMQVYVRGLQRSVDALQKDNELLRLQCSAIKYTFQVHVLPTSTKDNMAKSVTYKFGNGPSGYFRAGYSRDDSILVEFSVSPIVREWRVHVRALRPR